MADQGSRILESSGLPRLLDFGADVEDPDVGFLGPAHNEVAQDIESADLALAFREDQSLFDLSVEIEHVESEVSGDDEGVLVDEEAPQGLLLDGGNWSELQIVGLAYLDYLYFLAGPVKQFVSHQVETLDVPSRRVQTRHLLLAVFI